jgi:hypothetical protein
MILLTTKGNGRNYYWYEDWSKNPFEVIKMRGRFYRAKLIIGEWLIAVGNPLRNFYFNND